jgi:tRNA (adenine57-N1/adenine58-N1)-methyltransferase
MNINRMLVNAHGRTFIQQEAGEDVQTQFGLIFAKDIDPAQDGDVIQSANGEQLIVYTPQFIDEYKRIKRDAQIITFKDAGIIMATAGLGPESVVAEAGAGSGAMTVLLARHCKHVYTHDIDDHNLSVAKENCDAFGLENVTFTQHDITQGLQHGPVDALLLDMPIPWQVLDKTNNLKIGAYVITYTPSAIQLQQVRNTAEELGYQHIRTVEVTERHWKVKGDAVRPTSRNTAFTAFLCFLRWMGPNFKDIQPKAKPKSTGPKMPDEEVMQAAFDSQ